LIVCGSNVYYRTLHVKVSCYCSRTEWCKSETTVCDCPCVTVYYFKNSSDQWTP